MGRVCHGPSLLWAEMSSYPSRYMRAFGILPMVPLEILPMVPLVANGTIGNTRTLNVSRLPMVPLVAMLPLVETLVPMGMSVICVTPKPNPKWICRVENEIPS